MSRSASLNGEIARQRAIEIGRLAEHRAPLLAALAAGSERRQREPVTIRFAAAGDRCELARLADGGGGRVPVEPSLIGEVGNRLVAALSLADGSLVSDIGDATADVADLLQLRASQLLGGQRRTAGPLAALANTLARLRRRGARSVCSD